MTASERRKKNSRHLSEGEVNPAGKQSEKLFSLVSFSVDAASFPTECSLYRRYSRHQTQDIILFISSPSVIESTIELNYRLERERLCQQEWRSMVSRRTFHYLLISLVELKDMKW